MGVSPIELIFAIFVSFAAAVVQGSVGLGYNIISVPILALVDPRLAPVPQLVVSLPLSIAVVIRERSDIDVNGVGWILAGRLPGAAAGLGLLAVATQRALDFLLASFVLLAVAVFATGIRVRRSAGIDFAAGVASGITGLVASMGGPPLALLFSRERGPVLRSTMAVLFSVGVTLSIITRVLGRQITMAEVWVGLALIGPAAVGFLVSNRLLRRAEGNLLRTAVLALSATAATVLLVRAVAG